MSEAGNIMNIQSTGTQSSNITIDMMRADKEWLVRIKTWFWIVRLTDDAQRALSDRLAKLSEDGKLKTDDFDSSWSLTCIEAIRERPEPFSIDQYLADWEAKSGEVTGDD